MPSRPSIAQIRTHARAHAARIQSRAHQAARDNQHRVERRVRALTGNGARGLTRAQIQQLARESAEYFRNRMK